MRTMAKCAIAPSYCAPRISASQRAEASFSCGGAILWLSSIPISHLLHLPDSCGAETGLPQALLRLNHQDTKTPRTFTRFSRRHCEEQSDEAIQKPQMLPWIASLRSQ